MVTLDYEMYIMATFERTEITNQVQGTLTAITYSYIALLISRFMSRIKTQRSYGTSRYITTQEIHCDTISSFVTTI